MNYTDKVESIDGKMLEESVAFFRAVIFSASETGVLDKACISIQFENAPVLSTFLAKALASDDNAYFFMCQVIADATIERMPGLKDERFEFVRKQVRTKNISEDEKSKLN